MVSIPDSGYGSRAVPAFSGIETDLSDAVPVPADDGPAARRADGRLPLLSRDVADVDVAETCVEPGLASRAKCLCGGGRTVEEAVGGIETGDVPRGVGPQPVPDEGGDPLH